MSSRPDLTAGVRVRVPLVFVIPIGAILLLGAIAVGFSQVLLNLPKEGATVIALAFAANILIGCSVLALRHRTDAATMGELLVVVTYPVLIGAVLAIVGFGATDHAAGETDHGGGGGAEGGNSISAAGVQFNENELSFEADTPTDLDFVNEDSVAHNVSIYEDDSAEKDLFIGQEVAAGGQTTYSIPALKKGEYFFRCDLHPTSMVGDVIVE